MSNAIQTRFDCGEISSRLSGRFDSELYKKALRTCKEFEPLPQGSLRMRSGSGMERKLTGDALTRLIQIRMSTGTDYLVELLDRVAHIYSLNGASASAESVNVSELIYNGDFSLANGAGWQALNGITPDATDFSGGGRTAFNYNGASIGWCYFVGESTGGPGATGIPYQRIVVPFAATVRVKFKLSVNLGGSTFMVKISTSDPATWVDRVANGGEAFLYNAVPPGLTVHAGSSVNPPETDVDLGDVALAAGIYFVSFQAIQTGFSAALDNVSLIATYGVAQAVIPTPWSSLEAADVRFVSETGRDRTVFVHPSHKPWYLFYGGTPGNWTFGDIVFTGLPSAWGDAGSNNVPVGWNWQGQTAVLASANWPACVDMRDGRIYYSGEPAQKNRILGSRSGSTDDFTIGSNPGDALDFKVATKGAIRWLKGHRVLLAGTDLGGHSITGSKGTPLVGDIQAVDQSSFPSANVQPTVAGTKVLYVSADLRRIRASTFDLQTSGWESKDVTFASEHITADLVKELHHAWTPDSVIIVLLQSGKLAICSFEPEEQVTAWWTADFGGPIASCAVSQGPLGAYLWMAVLRPTGTYLEKLHLSESTESLRYLDSSISANADANGQVVGLDHLNDVNVRVTSNGAVLGDFLVFEGAIQLGADNANTAVAVGIPYLARAVTLPRDTRTGKAQSSMIGVILNNSAIPKINGKRVPDRSPATAMGNPTPLFTGKKKQLNPGWSEEDPVTVEQDLPLRTEVCALYATVSVERIA